MAASIALECGGKALVCGSRPWRGRRQARFVTRLHFCHQQFFCSRRTEACLWHRPAVRGRTEHVRSARVFQISTCSAIARASSTSMPRYLTVLSISVCPSRSWTTLRLPVRRSIRVAFVRRGECVPNSLGSSPTLPIHSDTSRAYWRVVILRSGPRRSVNKNSPSRLPVAFR
jgi:hypothetical protein